MLIGVIIIIVYFVLAELDLVSEYDKEGIMTTTLYPTSPFRNRIQLLHCNRLPWRDNKLRESCCIPRFHSKGEKVSWQITLFF